MRILWVTSQFPPDSYGGLETVLIGLGNYYQQAGHKIQIIAGRLVRESTDHGFTKEDFTDGLPVLRIGVNLEQRDKNKYLSVLDQVIYSKLVDYIKAFGPDIIHVIGMGYLTFAPIMAGINLGTPTIYSALNYELICSTSSLLMGDNSLCDGEAYFSKCLNCVRHKSVLADSIVKLLEGKDGNIWESTRMIVNGLSPRKIGILKVGASLAQRFQLLDRLEKELYVITPTEWVKKILTTSGFAPEHISIVRHGLANYSKSVHKSESDVLRFGYIGRINPTKGIDILIRAFQKLPITVKAKLTIYGSANTWEHAYFQELQELSSGDDRIEFFGKYERQEITKVFNAIDVVVLPSVWYENYPIALLEAISHRTPIIASEIGGVPELVSIHNAGWLFPHGDVDRLFELLLMCTNHPEKISEQVNRIRLPRPVSAEADEILSIYQILINKFSTAVDYEC